MFKINMEENSISPLQKKSFSELDLRERDNLQEWIAKTPDALGEDLLIIQKEFDGFNDTRERLDLLALDKDGNLVIIENKLDDSGRDVVWQALKYVAYCSTLTKSQIIKIYQEYLNSISSDFNAEEELSDFFDNQNIEDIILNSGTTQRFILVAANFRKEVTSTILWLLDNGIRAQCFKVTPYALGEELILDVAQIIPTPEVAEFMISMSSKIAEQKDTQGAVLRRHKLRLEFWELTLQSFRKQNISTFANISPSKDHWVSAGSGIRGCPFNLIFGKQEIRVEFIMARSDRDDNKTLFDRLHSQKSEFEDSFGKPLKWERLDAKKSCRVSINCDVDGYNKENWLEMADWLAQNFIEFERSIRPIINKLQKIL